VFASPACSPVDARAYSRLDHRQIDGESSQHSSAREVRRLHLPSHPIEEDHPDDHREHRDQVRVENRERSQVRFKTRQFQERAQYRGQDRSHDHAKEPAWKIRARDRDNQVADGQRQRRQGCQRPLDAHRHRTSVRSKHLLNHVVGRRRIDSEIRALIRRMSRENPLWSSLRIHGESLMLGIEVAESTGVGYMVRRRRPPSQGWRTSLRNHVAGIASLDLFVVRTISFKLSCGLVILRHARRRLVTISVTANPTDRVDRWAGY